MGKEIKTAVILLSMGGPLSLSGVWLFLFNLFRDKAILRLPAVPRYCLAALIASLRAGEAKKNYARLGGRSPLLENTEKQGRALEAALAMFGTYRCFIGMSYAPPSIRQAVRAVKDYAPERVVLLPLYPQYSTTTTESALLAAKKDCARYKLSSQGNFLFDFFCRDCGRERRKKIEPGIQGQENSSLDSLDPGSPICASHGRAPRQSRMTRRGVSIISIQSFYDSPFFVDVLRARAQEAFEELKKQQSAAPKLLFSAHGLPLSIVAAGDPYPLQCEKTVAAIMSGWQGERPQDPVLCYQSKVGRGAWLAPATRDEMEKAGRAGRPLIVVPIAFVSEHSETLVELAMDYKEAAERAGSPAVLILETVSEDPVFINGLAKRIAESE